MNMVARTYPLAEQHWQQAVDYSLEKDFISQSYGEMLSQEKILEMRNARQRSYLSKKGEVYTN